VKGCACLKARGMEEDAGIAALLPASRACPFCGCCVLKEDAGIAALHSAARACPFSDRCVVEEDAGIAALLSAAALAALASGIAALLFGALAVLACPFSGRCVLGGKDLRLSGDKRDHIPPVLSSGSSCCC